ncbi:glycoside hydrolase family 2 TIM barrel-domain containing protein [Wenyingzhuangia sp. IMCC45574]
MTLKRIILSLFLIVSFSVLSQNRVRINKSFNKDWKFSLTDSLHYTDKDYKDVAWRKLNLPHDWSMEGALSKKNSGRNAWLPGGVGWYRKTFSLPKEYKGKYVEIQFDAIYRNSKIWINGVYVGAQYNGFTSFYYDITEYLNFDQPNVIAVRVDHSDIPSARWYTGSGIYRNTWLTVTDQIHVKKWGTKITTPKVLEKEALVKVETILENFKGKATVEVRTVLFDEDQKRVGESKKKLKVNLKTTYKTIQKIKLLYPKKWDVFSPSLYTAKTEIIVDGNVVDDYKSVFGVRTLNFDAKEGFFLNGNPLKMKGVCLHVDAGSMGVSVPVEVWEKRLKALKSVGCNAIRTAHNVAAPEFMDLCDRMGFLVMDEFVDKWNDDGLGRGKKRKGNFFNPMGFANPYFETEWQKNYEQSVRRDINHPSVVIWSVGNENHSPGTIEQKVGLKKYTNFVRSIDATRPVISGMERGRDEVPADKVRKIIETCEYMDLIALNYGEQWCKAIGAKNPGKPFVSTESYTYFNSTPEKRFANIEKSPWFDVLENNHNMGLFLWSGIDYLGESKKWPKLGTDSGLLDFAGFKKNRAYFYQSVWTEEPMIKTYVYEGDADDFSTSGRWGWPPMGSSWNLEKDKKYDLVTYTNCEIVVLYLNGRKIGSQKIADFPNKIMKWSKIPYEPGELKAIGYVSGKKVADYTLYTTKKPAKIKLKSDKSLVKKGDIVHVEVELVDRKGKLVVWEPLDLSLEVSGKARVLAFDNGNMSDHASFVTKKKCKTNNGKCLIVLEVLDDDKLEIKVSSTELKTVKMYLKNKSL